MPEHVLLLLRASHLRTRQRIASSVKSSKCCEFVSGMRGLSGDAWRQNRAFNSSRNVISCLRSKSVITTRCQVCLARWIAANMSFNTARSPKACGIVRVRRRSSRNKRSKRLVVRVARRCATGRRSALHRPRNRHQSSAWRWATRAARCCGTLQRRSRPSSGSKRDRPPRPRP